MHYGRMYSISFSEVAATLAQDLFEILAPSDNIFILHKCVISQSSDAGDVQDEQLFTSIRRVSGAPASGSGGSVSTPRPLHQGDAAAGVTAEVNNTTVLTGGTDVVLWAESWNVRNGFSFYPAPEDRLIFSPATRCVIDMTAPNDSLTISGTVLIEEIGG